MSDQNSNPTCVAFTGEVTVSTIAKAHEKLFAEFQQNDAIVLDATGITEADLTFVQLIESARLTATAQDKSFALSAPASGPLLEVLERGGFVNAQRNINTDFWLQTAEEK